MADVRATFTAEGRKNRAVVKLEEIEQISSLHRKENEGNGMFLKNPLVFTFLHRLHLKQAEIAKRSGKPVQQMAMAEDMERRRK